MEHNREAIRQIMISINIMDRIYANFAKKLGAKEKALALLYALDDGKLHSQKEVSEHWFIPRTTLNTIIKEFEEKGYVTFQSIPGQRREKYICLTETGVAYTKELLDPLVEIEDWAMCETLKTYSIEFGEQFFYFCEKIREGLEQFDRGVMEE